MLILISVMLQMVKLLIGLCCCIYCIAFYINKTKNPDPTVTRIAATKELIRTIQSRASALLKSWSSKIVKYEEFGNYVRDKVNDVQNNIRTYFFFVHDDIKCCINDNPSKRYLIRVVNGFFLQSARINNANSELDFACDIIQKPFMDFVKIIIKDKLP
ncbi:hypothetical protein BDC45DRAFT_541284 [Circinella umbellata]|nr:hypothetical protein BDC45DRAFT_541284 [Circinella umbellata]